MPQTMKTLRLSTGESVSIGYNWRSLDMAFSAVKSPELEDVFFRALTYGTINGATMAKGLYVLYVSALVIENDMKLPTEGVMGQDEFLDALPLDPSEIYSLWSGVLFPN